MSSTENAKGIIKHITLPHPDFAGQWSNIFVADGLKDRLLSQAILEFTIRGNLPHTSVPLHGIILLVGPPGTGKTSLARGLAHRVAESLPGATFHFLEVEPHGLASHALGKSQRAVTELLQGTIAEYAASGPLIVLLDEVETLAVDRRRLSFEANPVDVHRATDAVLASVDILAADYPHLLFVATSNFPEAVDEALRSRADFIEIVGKPSEVGCRAILLDTLGALGTQWSEVKQLAESSVIADLAREAIGLDGREIRKAVLHACASSKDVALNPNLLRAELISQSLKERREVNNLWA